MYGVLTSAFSLTCVVTFSFLLYFSDNLILSWLSLELATLSAVPSFFLNQGTGPLNSLYNFLVISGVSSGFMVLGIIFPEMIFFIILGFFVKFGIFPFIGWVYSVCVKSNWLVVYIFSVILKSSFLIISFFLNGPCYYYTCCIFASFTLLLLSVLFWVYNFSWFHCWTHMMLSSSCLIGCMALFLSTYTLFWFYCGYFIWSSCCVGYLYRYSKYGVSGPTLSYFFYIFLFLATPLSLSLVYKVLISFSVFSCPFVLVMCWVVYSLSEQFYLFFYLTSSHSPKKCAGLYSLVWWGSLINTFTLHVKIGFYPITSRRYN